MSRIVSQVCALLAIATSLIPQTVVAGQSIDAHELVCHIDQHGSWQNSNCLPGEICTARCNPLLHCDAPLATEVIAHCRKQSSCTSLIIHRRLSRLGCAFRPDAFWVAPNAKVLERSGEETRNGVAIFDFEPESSCRIHDLKGMQNALNKPAFSESPNGHIEVFAFLLQHGCNVDLSTMRAGGKYREVTLSFDRRGPADASGLEPQPRLNVTFTEWRSEETLIQPGMFSACDALHRLHNANCFAACNSEDGGLGARIRILSGSDESSNNEQPIDFELPKNFNDPAAKGGSNGVQASASTSEASESVVPISVAPAALSVTGAVSSAGVGAMLAALAKWLYGMFSKKGHADAASNEVTRHAQDVHLTVSLGDEPDIDVRPKKRTLRPFGRRRRR